MVVALSGSGAEASGAGDLDCGTVGLGTFVVAAEGVDVAIAELVGTTLGAAIAAIGSVNTDTGGTARVRSHCAKLRISHPDGSQFGSGSMSARSSCTSLGHPW